MPWSVRRDSRCPVSKPFAVVKVDGELEGCHASRGDARAQQAALYASEATKSLGFVPLSLKDFDPNQARWPKGHPRAGQWRPKLATGAGRVAPGHLDRDLANVRALIDDATQYGPRLSRHDVDAIGKEVEKVALRYSARKVYEKRLADVHAARKAIEDAKWDAFEAAFHGESDMAKVRAMEPADFLSAKDADRLAELCDEQIRLLRERDRADRDAMLGVLQKIRPMGGTLNRESIAAVDKTSNIERRYGEDRPAGEVRAAMTSDLDASLRSVLKVVPKAWLDDTNDKGKVAFLFSTERAYANTHEVDAKPSSGQITSKQHDAITRAVNQGGSFEGMYDGRYPVVRRPGTEEGGIGPYAAIYDWIDETGAAKNLQYEPSAPPGGYDERKWKRDAARPPVTPARHDTVIRIDPRPQNRNTLLHELCHRLETVYGEEGMSGYNPLAGATEAFRRERTQGETPQKLQDLYPGYAYEDHEMTLPDKFVDGYVGKLYPGQSTEVLTMGMEMLWFPRYGERDINKDPEYRQLILGMLAAM